MHQRLFFDLRCRIYRSLSWAGRLGIHRPQLEHKVVPLTENEITVATNVARNVIRLYLKKMNVPDKYLDLMYSVPTNELRWISQDEFEFRFKRVRPRSEGFAQRKMQSAPGPN